MKQSIMFLQVRHDLVERIEYSLESFVQRAEIVYGSWLVSQLGPIISCVRDTTNLALQVKAEINSLSDLRYNLLDITKFSFLHFHLPIRLAYFSNPFFQQGKLFSQEFPGFSIWEIIMWHPSPLFISL